MDFCRKQVIKTLSSYCLVATLLVGLHSAVAPIGALGQAQLQVGVLVCQGERSWNAIIVSSQHFRCTFSASHGTLRELYFGKISRFGLDLGVRGNTSLTWLVFGPAETVGTSYAPGALAGSYAGVGADAAIGAGLGANVLTGGSQSSFTLQPISVQVQTGLSIAAGVRTLELQFFEVIQ